MLLVETMRFIILSLSHTLFVIFRNSYIQAENRLIIIAVKLYLTNLCTECTAEKCLPRTVAFCECSFTFDTIIGSELKYLSTVVEVLAVSCK